MNSTTRLSPSSPPLTTQRRALLPAPPFRNLTSTSVTPRSRSCGSILVPSFCFDRRAIFRRRLPISMSSRITVINELEMTELREESDFEKILSPSGHISICGFGSLLSERSARSTFPDLINFRVARLTGFRRVFAHAAPIFFERGIAKPETMEISSLSVEPCEGESLIVTVFEIQKSEIPAFIKRELEFRFVAVLPQSLDGKPFEILAVLCARYSDEEFFQIRCKGSLLDHFASFDDKILYSTGVSAAGSKDIYFEHYGRHGITKIWRDDVLPCRVYLRHCVLAAKNLSNVAYNNFLEHTYLSDRKTSIREYFETAGGAGIMEEDPPESLKSRYGG